MEIPGPQHAAPAAVAEPLAPKLNKTLGRVGRALRYRTRAAREALGVTDSEGELLRLVGRKPGIHVQAAATELGVASNSVSTLVKQLTREGLITRGSDPLDGRVACLRLTAQAEAWVNDVGSAREEVLGNALAELDSSDRDALERALPVLARIAQAVRGR